MELSGELLNCCIDRYCYILLVFFSFLKNKEIKDLLIFNTEITMFK